MLPMTIGIIVILLGLKSNWAGSLNLEQMICAETVGTGRRVILKVIDTQIKDRND